MSWINKLYETYENCQTMIGVDGEENEVPLLPIGHTTQKAQIEIVINGTGDFLRARVLSKNESRTVIPCTESSGGRSGIRPAAHPLCDKLQYIAKDFTDFGGVVTKGFQKEPLKPYKDYQSLLGGWSSSEYSHLKVKAVYQYTSKGNVVRDLVESQILFIDATTKKLLEKKIGDFDVFQSDAFVRWIVEIPNEPNSSISNDYILHKNWINYYLTTKGKGEFCFISGNEEPIADQHPAKIRNDGDKARIISSNDSSGFTFRGKFNDANQACSIGFEVTQKAHNALRWLISKQGYKRGNLAIVAWSVGGKDLPNPFEDTFSILGLGSMEIEETKIPNTSQDLAIRLKKMIAGYSHEISNTEEIVVLGVDSATEGRLSITYYRELAKSDFFNLVEKWHKESVWIHQYRLIESIDKRTGKKIKKFPVFAGAPSPSDIAEVAYGKNVDDKLRKKTIERILPCIIDGEKIPRDLVESAVRRASNCGALEAFEWTKALSIACSLFRKFKLDYEKEEIDLALEINRKTRDYLYGRLLALAESVEQWALSNSGEKRQTNAERLMQRFSERPYSTWRTIELSLSPYFARLGGAAINRKKLIDDVMNMFDEKDFTDDKKLSGEFLLGYHCQRSALWSNKEGN